MLFQRRLLNEHIGFFVIMTFQFIGTLLFTFANINAINLSQETSSPLLKQIYLSVFFALSLFLCLSIGRQFSGGLYNPSVVVYRMLRIKQRFPIKMGLAYLITQFLGAIVGAVLAFWINNLHYTSIMIDFPTKHQLKLLYFQAIGTFVLTIMVQYVNQKKMTFIQHNRQFYIIQPLFFLIARQYAFQSNGLNPALGFGYQLSYCIFNGNWNIFYQTYILVTGPIIGTIIAVIIFQFLLKPFYPLKRSQIENQIQQQHKIRQQQRIKQQELILTRITKITQFQNLQNNKIINDKNIQYQKHKYNLNQINSLKPQNTIYLIADQEFTIVEDITYYDQAASASESDEENKIQQQQISFKNLSFKQTQTKSFKIKPLDQLSDRKKSLKIIKKFQY